MRYFLFLFLICCLVSCRTVKNITVHKEIPFITENKLFKNIYSNELVYNTLYVKRADISVTLDKKSVSCKASLKIKRDSFIQVSVTLPLGIELGRVLLTPDSIKFIDSFNKKYFLGDYSYFYDKFDARLSYSCFQNMLTNVFFNLEECGGIILKDKKYKFDILGDYYQLSSVEEKALSRKIKKLLKGKRINKDFALVMQKIDIDPVSFRPKKISLEDLEDNMGVSINYADYNDYSGKLFPGKIIFELLFAGNKTKLEIDFTKIEFDTEIEPNFRISSKYKPINLKL